MLTNHPLLEKRPAGPAFMLALVIGLATFAVMTGLLFEWLPPIGWFDDHAFPATLDWLLPYISGKFQQAQQSAFDLNPFSRLSWAAHSAFSQTFPNFDLTTACTWRLAAIFGTATVTGIVAGAAFYCSGEPVDGVKHLSGRRLWRGYAAIVQARRVVRKAIALSGAGLFIAPGLTISRVQETQHIGLFGTSGAGKSIILRWLIEQILNRNNKMVVHDTKGDMTACLPTQNLILLAPHDERSFAWDVAADITSVQDARELAARLIPDSHDPIWASAAREVLCGMIVHLQRCKPRAWTWQDLFDTAFLPVAQLVSALTEAYKPASRLIELTDDGHPTKTSFGILVNTWAELTGVVRPLADAWGQCPPLKRLSLRRWLMDNIEAPSHVLVLQRSPRYPALSAAWIGAAIDCLAATAASADLPDSDQRRIWLMLDEFPQLGKLKAFRQLLEVGRSKGICCVLAMQDIQQLTALYGDAETKTILTLLGQKIIGRMPAGPSATMISEELIGKRDVAWTEVSTSASDGKTTYSRHTHRDKIPVVPVEQLESRLGVDRKGVRALLLGLGDVYELRWPLLFWPRLRAETKPRVDAAIAKLWGRATAEDIPSAALKEPEDGKAKA